MKKSGYALVLSGGGAKGVYHIGAWRALRELKIPIRAVIGNSVGALIAGFVAQDAFDAAEKAIGSIGLEKVVKLPGGMVKDGKLVVTRKTMDHIATIQDEIMQHQGLNTGPLRKMLNENLDEEKIRKSGMELGIATYQLSSLKPVEIFVDQMEKGHLLDYLMASASLPGFKATEIKKKKYIDGGVFNNIPFNMASERGFKKIIVIDISGLGANKRPDIEGTQTVYIKNSINMGGILDFDPEFLEDYKKLGYLDTLKVFEAVDGIDYFINADKKLYRQIDNLLDSTTVTEKIRELFHEKNKKKRDLDTRSMVRDLLPNDMKLHANLPLVLAECAAASLAIPKIEQYDFEEFISLIQEKYCEVDRQLDVLQRTLSAKKITNLVKRLARLAGDTELEDLKDTTLYEYQRVLELLLDVSRIPLPFKTLSHIFHHVAGARIFYIVLQEYFGTDRC
jgi:NTE family protein